MIAETMATIEVVICTYNNASMLDDVLTALGNQRRVENGRWSCLVVDNNCTDRTQEIVENHRRRAAIPHLRIVREMQQGLTPARVRGVRSTNAAWVAFVDDDCLLEPGWIGAAIGFANRHPSAGAFGGQVTIDFERQPAAYVRSYAYSFAQQNHGEAERKVPFLVGAGLVANRAALLECGWLDGPLVADRVGRRLVSGGDVEIVLRIMSAGYDLWYAPACELRHRIPTRRTSLRYLVALNHGLGASQSLADALVWDGAPAAWPAAAARQLLRELISLRRLALSVVRGRNAAAEMAIQASFKVGRAIGISRVLRMPTEQRKRLIGRARPPAERDSAPTSAA